MSEIEKAIQVLKVRANFTADINLDAQMAYKFAIQALQEKLEREEGFEFATPRHDNENRCKHRCCNICDNLRHEKEEREIPKPLTLEEIMAIKQPVPLFKILILDDTGEYIGANNRWWDVCCGTTAQSGLVYWRSGHVNRVEDYGVNWVVYWHKPKDIEHIGEATNMAEGE